jgi:hypothetical protein
MSQDIDAAVSGWEYKPGVVQARLVEANDGRQVLQLRVDLGLLQMETANRPDGLRPHGFATYHHYLVKQSQLSERSSRTFVLNEEQCQEADREFVQYYHRRLCWLALHQYAQAVADADHTLAFMDFVRDHSPNEEFTQAHEQYRGFVLFQRTQAEAAMHVDKDDPERAIDAINEGLEKLRSFFAVYDLEDQFEENGMVQQLRKMADSLRKTHNIEATLLEQLNDAVANEQYEDAARLRDALKRRK